MTYETRKLTKKVVDADVRREIADAAIAGHLDGYTTNISMNGERQDIPVDSFYAMGAQELDSCPGKAAMPHYLQTPCIADTVRDAPEVERDFASSISPYAVIKESIGAVVKSIYGGLVRKKDPLDLSHLEGTLTYESNC